MELIYNYKKFIILSYLICTIIMFAFGMVEHPGDVMNRLATAMTQGMMVSVLAFSIKIIHDTNKEMRNNDAANSK